MKLTIPKAARAFGIDPATLKKRLEAAGFELEAGKAWPVADLAAAIHGGTLEREKIRLTRAEAELKEKELQIQRGDLITSEQAKAIIVEVLGPVRAALTSWPAGLAARCNPSDPELAREVLAGAVKQLLTDASQKKD